MNISSATLLLRLVCPSNYQETVVGTSHNNEYFSCYTVITTSVP